jgi:hypothetical protein
MIDGHDVTQPEANHLALAGGGGVLLLDPNAQSPTQLRLMQRRRMIQLPPAELCFSRSER